VTPGSAADKAGLKTGDAVVAVNGEALEGADSLVARVRALRPGTVVTMSVVRDGATTDIKVTLGERPADNR
jgi:putative serine protease PepD